MKAVDDETCKVVTPGDVIGKASELSSGKGTYVSTDAGGVKLVYAALTGSLSLRSPSDSDKRLIAEVTGHKAHGAVPEPDCIVLCRVKKVTPKMASADILCVGEKAIKEKFTGIIRQQNVRETEIDKVDMYASFRAGDIVKAMVRSLGDARAYYLSTTKNELGVVSAESSAGEKMVPISWTEMQCPVTGQIEQRKVAKVEN
ncbi:uncharacterized protein LOC141642800 isoform X2 [Silene latifolia]|uniref:uncharacterized protein LOC141642800 isoform X2 n=1 Tax=Silene latifolia TaxID=37657 RepID=UPI003D76FA55